VHLSSNKKLFSEQDRHWSSFVDEQILQSGSEHCLQVELTEAKPSPQESRQVPFLRCREPLQDRQSGLVEQVRQVG
jgi:hypothetical protein